MASGRGAGGAGGHTQWPVALALAVVATGDAAAAAAAVAAAVVVVVLIIVLILVHHCSNNSKRLALAQNRPNAYYTPSWDFLPK